MPSTQKLLVRGVNWLGDAVMTTPALQRLRERLPQAHIALLTHEKLADLWRGHPSINKAITFAGRESPMAVARKVRQENFDTALIFPNSPRSALECWLARIPRRIGYERAWRKLLLTSVIPTRLGHVGMHKRTVHEIKELINSPPSNRPRIPNTAHHIHEYLHLAAASLGANPDPIAPRLNVLRDETEAAVEKFKLPADRPIFAVNPGAEYGPAKRWPAEHFIAAMREIQQHSNCTWLIVGGSGDVPLAAEIHSALGNPQFALNLAGQTTLRELMAVLKQSRVLLTNDSGPMHVAAALGTPVVVPFGSTSPELTGPGLPGDPRHSLLSAHVACSPCFLRECPIDFRCMQNITLNGVVEAVQKTAAPGSA